MADVVLDAHLLQERLAKELPSWSLDDGHLTRRIRTHGFRSALLVANAIGHLAELAWHHPELVVSYGSLTVRLTTHSAGGVTEKDVALAGRIDHLVGWRPGEEDGPLQGPPPDARYAYP